MYESDSRSERTADKEASNDGALEKSRTDVEWVAQFNLALNEDLERYYGHCDSLCKMAVSLFGTYAFASLFIDKSVFYSACGLAVTFISMMMLVVDFNDKKIRAKNQRNRYNAAVTAIKMADGVKDIDSVAVSLSDIAKDDLPTGEICDAIAVNTAIDRMGLDSAYKAKVNWFKRLTRYVLPWGRPKYGHG